MKKEKWNHTENAVKPVLADFATSSVMVGLQIARNNKTGEVSCKTALFDGQGNSAMTDFPCEDFLKELCDYIYHVLQTPDDFEEFCEFIEKKDFEYKKDEMERRVQDYVMKTAERKMLNKIIALRAAEIEKP